MFHDVIELVKAIHDMIISFLERKGRTFGLVDVTSSRKNLELRVDDVFRICHRMGQLKCVVALAV